MYLFTDASEAGSSDCVDWETWEDDDDDDDDSRGGGHGHDHDDDDISDGEVAGIVFAIVLLLIVLGAIAACVICFVCSVKTRSKRLVGFQGCEMQTAGGGRAGLTPVGGAFVAQQSMASPPPAYQTNAGIGGQVYGYDQKVHPDQLYGNTTVSPPPAYTTPPN